MASKVAIANFALAGELGKDTITALTDNTAGAKLVNLLFDDTAQEVMTLGAFTSATFRQTLAQDAVAPDWGYNFRYVLPTNPKFLGVIKLNELRPDDIQHTIESGYLLTDESSVKLLYKGWQTNTEAWDKMLERAVVLRLAHKMAYPLTGNIELKQHLWGEFLEAMDTGLGVDGLNNGNVDDITYTEELKDVR